MNTLNSLILEGKVANVKTNEDSLTFDIVSESICKGSNGEWVEKKSYIPNRVVGNMKKAFAERITENREVRVVGRIETYENKTTVLVEHLELKMVRGGNS